MPIKNYTTTVSAHQSVGEIIGALAAHGASSIQVDYAEGKPIAISFAITTPAGPRGFRLPANVDKVAKVMAGQKIKSTPEQAERVAWRILRDWVAAQMAILETEMVAMDEVFLPYMINSQGQTVYQLYQGKQLLLGD